MSEIVVTKKVKLLVVSCCGCGCEEVSILREVAEDSPLKDGDLVDSFEENDEILDEDDD